MGVQCRENYLIVLSTEAKEVFMPITKSRPVGVTIIAVLLGIQGALEVIYGMLVLISAPGFVSIYGNTAIVVRVSPWAFLISGVLALILAYGLWTLRSWAFWITVILEVINLIGGAIQLFTTYYPWAVLLSMIVPAVILIYFLADSNVRQAFSTESLPDLSQEHSPNP
jgi:hypothetical protein